MSDSKKVFVTASAPIKVRKTDHSMCALDCPHLFDGQDCHLFRITNDVLGDDTYRARDENKIFRNTQCLTGEEGVGAIQMGEFTWERGERHERHHN